MKKNTGREKKEVIIHNEAIELGVHPQEKGFGSGVGPWKQREGTSWQVGSLHTTVATTATDFNGLRDLTRTE